MTGIERHWMEESESARIRRRARLTELVTKYATILNEISSLRNEFYQASMQNVQGLPLGYGFREPHGIMSLLGGIGSGSIQ